MIIKKIIGGLRWGDAFWDNTWQGNVTFPFAILQIESDKCILTRSFFWLHRVSYIIKFEELSYVTPKRFLFSKGLLFVHANKEIPKYLLFWTRKTVEICNILRERGVAIKQGDLRP